MFQNVDFSYTNSYDEEKVINLLTITILKEIIANDGDYENIEINVAELIYKDGSNEKTAKDIINYYIGHHYKFYKTMDEMVECEMGLENEPYYLNKDYYGIIAGYLINTRIDHSKIFD